MAHFHNPNLAGAGGQGGYQIERSLRFNSADSAYLNRTPASAGNRRTFTWSFWLKRAAALSTNTRIFTVYDPSSGFTDSLYFGTSDAMSFWLADASAAVFTTSQVFRDCSAWYHIVLAIDTTQGTNTNRIKLYVNGSQVTAFSSISYPGPNHDCYVNNTGVHYIGSSASASQYFNGYLTEFYLIDGQALTPSSFGETDTSTGVWKPKKYSGSGYGTNGFYLKFAQNSIGVDLTSTATITAPFGGTAENARVSDSVYLISNTTTGATFTLVQEDFGSVKQLSRYYIAAMYFTGGTSTFELQYSTNGSSWTTAASLSITASGQNFSGNINVNARYVRLQATAFGVNGQGGIDSLIIYQDPLGVDSSPNSNNWNVNNFSIVAGAGNDSLIDTPTPYADGGNGRGNYCTLNAVDKNANITPSNGNLDIVGVGAAHRAIRATIAVSSGKWYWEATVNSYNSGLFGIAKNDLSLADGNYVGANATSWGYLGNGNKYNNGSAAAYGASFTTGDVIGVALDADNGTLVFYKNNVSQGTAYTGLTSGPYFPAVSTYSASDSYSLNFGQRAFAYTPPSGFLALNTQNLPEPSIKKPSSYFDTKLWTGNGTSQTISGLGFSPDLVWAKRRSTTASHGLVDSVRGTGKTLFSNLTDQEDTGDSNLTAFNSDGFTAGSGGNFNANGETYVGWCWDESATPGFDIVTYTGNGTNRTIAHSLGVAPSMMIVKRRTTAGGDWDVYHSATGATKRLFLNTTAAAQTTSVAWNDTAPTSSVFTVGTGADVNQNGDTHVAYLFSEVASFSKFGSYVGNGSTDGPFVFCGFRPRLVMIKCSSASGTNWVMYDTSRNPSNVSELVLVANGSQSEASGITYPHAIDILSNGFKTRNYDATYGVNINTSGATYIFAAFAETPAKYSLAR